MKTRTLVVTSALVVGAAAVGVGVLNSSLPHRDLPDDFDFHAEAVTADRRAAVVDLDRELEALERRSGLTHIGSRGRYDVCEPGQDNFTRQDAYAYVCTISIVQVVALPEPVRRNASLLGEALIEGDCPGGTDTDRALATRLPLGELNETGGECTRGLQVAGAPRISGWIPAHPTQRQLSVAETRLPRIFCRPTQRPLLCEQSPLDLEPAISAVPPNAAYLAILIAREDYHKVPW